jgi:hypothetical protein
MCVCSASTSPSGGGRSLAARRSGAAETVAWARGQAENGVYGARPIGEHGPLQSWARFAQSFIHGPIHSPA